MLAYVAASPVMTAALGVLPKRTRDCSSKVRTGCKTCKARRVKCDEAKPICRRCAAIGRKCEYAANPSPPPRNVVTVYLPPAQSQPLFFVNDHGLDFFHQNLAAKLDGQFDSEFWSKLVMQLSHSEPSIRHAVSAISIVCQNIEESNSRHPAVRVTAGSKAQQEWHTAMKSLSARIEAHPNSNLVPLICCLLFTCIEFLIGNVESSMLHVLSGFNILAAVRRNNAAVSAPDSDFSLDDLKAIENHIVPVFSRLSILCSLNGKLTPPVDILTVEEDLPQEDLGDSRRRLVRILDPCIRFIHKVMPKAAMFQISVDDVIEQHKLQLRLDKWYDQLDEVLERLKGAGKPVKQGALNLLLVHYKVTYIWMRVCTIPGEMATDSYQSEFEELVDCVEQVVSSGVEVATPAPLSFDIQILGPLYFAALKCRHPTTRRRALKMLQFAPRREGLWNAHYAYMTAKRVIELEERHLNGRGLPDETSRVHGLPLPDDESRIYDLQEIPHNPRNLGHSVVPSLAVSGTLEAVFYTKPWGLSGDWQITAEYIKL